EMAKFREKELPLWQRFWDSIIRSVQAGPLMGAPGLGPFGGAVQADLNKKQEEYNRLVTDAGIEIVRGRDATKQWADEQAKLPESLTLYLDRTAKLRGELDSLTEQLRAAPGDEALQAAFRTKAK